MSTTYIIFLIVFIIVLSLFAYLGAKNGFLVSFNSLLRLAIPMLLSGVIVKIAQLISRVDMIIFIVAGISTVIFYLVLHTVIVAPEKSRKLNIFDYFLGLLIGLAQGWLLIGAVVLYLQFFNIVHFTGFISSAFYQAIITPASWLMFLSFLRF